MGVSQSKKKTPSTKDLKLYASRHMTTSSTSTNGSQTKKSDQKSSNKHSSSSNDSRPTTPITMNSNPIMNRISSITGRSPPSYQSTPSPADKPMNYHQSNSFFLPKDWESRNYEDNLHFALKTVFGGNVSQAVLPRLQKGAHVIQLGACTSTWMMDMATQFPFCQFTGIEVTPGSLLKEFPPLPNVTFERGKAPTEIMESIPDNSVDYIHLRSCSSFFTFDQLNKAFEESYRILKPEGVIRVEDIHNQASGTVMIESFVETLRNIAAVNNIEFDFAIKAGNVASQHNFSVIESRKKRVQYGSDGKVTEEFIMFLLGIFEELTDFLAPQLGLDPEDYKLRVEMFCAQCVKNDAHMDWYSWVFQKP